jgi:hypothetical protein
MRTLITSENTGFTLFTQSAVPVYLENLIIMKQLRRGRGLLGRPHY